MVVFYIDKEDDHKAKGYDKLIQMFAFQVHIFIV